MPRTSVSSDQGADADDLRQALGQAVLEADDVEDDQGGQQS